MKALCLAALCALASTANAQTTATTTTPATTTSTTEAVVIPAPYLARSEARFGTWAGSSENVSSLLTGLRTGGEVTLIGSGESVTFTSPARPMGYGNITRALDLAQRQLAASGIKDPTPSELQAALTGGSVTGPNGTITYEGILQMRASGMGWGQIAHAVGVHPGLGRPVVATTASPRASGIVSAGSGSPFSPGNSAGRALGRSNNSSAGNGGGHAGAAAAAGGNGNGAIRAAAAGGNGNAFGRSK